MFDQCHAGEPVWVVGRPGQAPLATEVVQHQVNALDAELVDDAAEVVGVAVDGVVEANRFIGAANQPLGPDYRARTRPLVHIGRSGMKVRAANPVDCDGVLDDRASC
jgi:hypothetical protein